MMIMKPGLKFTVPIDSESPMACGFKLLQGFKLDHLGPGGWWSSSSHRV